VPTVEREPGRRRALRVLWVLSVVALAAALGVLRTLEEPAVLERSLAAALGVAFALGLAVRTGTTVVLPTALATCVGVAAVLTEWHPLLAGSAVATGVLAACLAVLGTRPAPSPLRTVMEVVLALLVATAGGLAAAGFRVRVDHERFSYVVLGLAVAAAVVLVHRLGGGLHGLGRRGVILFAGALVLLVVVLVYTAAFTRYGSPEVIGQVRSAREWVREHLGGVPHPVEVLVGIPALAWGVSMRAHRRQGWWACAFGTAATAHTVTDLLGRENTVASEALATVYGLVLGLFLGWVLIRLEHLLTGREERRTTRAAGPDVRPEPARLQPLQ
jgi:hypothetical protein